MRITNHAKERIQERGITVSQLVDAVKHGKRLEHKNNPERLVVRTNEIYMIFDKAMTTLITVFVNERFA